MPRVKQCADGADQHGRGPEPVPDRGFFLRAQGGEAELSGDGPDEGGDRPARGTENQHCRTGRHQDRHDDFAAGSPTGICLGKQQDDADGHCRRPDDLYGG